ncbi:MAG: Chromosome partition protein Smc [Chlamydiae bacterium]|nr:Chromosome partition protein Smc [Chlamydiota bacterium]
MSFVAIVNEGNSENLLALVHQKKTMGAFRGEGQVVDILDMTLSVESLANYFFLKVADLKNLKAEESIVKPGIAYQNTVYDYRNTFYPGMKKALGLGVNFCTEMFSMYKEMFMEELDKKEYSKGDLKDVLDMISKDLTELKTGFDKLKIQKDLYSKSITEFSRGLGTFSVAVKNSISACTDGVKDADADKDKQIKLHMETNESLDKTIAEISKIKNEIDATNAKLSESRASIHSLDHSIVDLIFAIEGNKTDIELQETYKTYLNEQMSYILSQKDNLQIRKSAIEDAISKLRKYRRTLKANLRSEVANRENAKNGFWNSLKRVAGLSTGDSAIDEKFNAIEKQTDEDLDYLEKQLVTMGETIDKTDREIGIKQQELSEHQDQIKGTDAKIIDIEKKIVKIKKQRVKLDIDKANIEEQMVRLENGKVFYQKVQLEAVNKKKVITNKIVEILESIEGFEDKARRFSDLSSRLENMQPNPRFLYTIKKLSVFFDTSLIALFAELEGGLDCIRTPLGKAELFTEKNLKLEWLKKPFLRIEKPVGVFHQICLRTENDTAPSIDAIQQKSIQPKAIEN